MSLEVHCLSFRQPYATLVLNGVKTIESRWRPLLSEMQNSTLAVHIAWKSWEGEDWRLILTERLGMTSKQTEELLESGERFGRSVIAGLVDVGETWCCPDNVPCEEMKKLETAACLTELNLKYLTRLSNPRWLNEPMYARGHKDVWTVNIPIRLLPSASSVSEGTLGQAFTGDL
nr:uncharacterized protein LOC550336 isoform X1 [Danio rerio]|eukprot:XP_021324494.1 uncharacterized protein LOC550336 isoform X1 [Danio rerio]